MLLNMEKKCIADMFAENLVDYRSKKGLSQYDLAQMTGISRAAISHYEREGIIPPADKLELLAHTLGIPVYKLFCHADETIAPTDLTGIDARSVKKLRDILSLSVEDRNDLYRILNKMLRKNQLERLG
jgi:transcriptional regulator with XRE-family HTH domain